MKQLRCSPGDTWDGVAFRVFGDSFRASDIMAVNLKMTAIVLFEGGEVINIPDDDPSLDTSGLPPWRR